MSSKLVPEGDWFLSRGAPREVVLRPKSEKYGGFNGINVDSYNVTEKSLSSLDLHKWSPQFSPRGCRT